MTKKQTNNRIMEIDRATALTLTTWHLIDNDESLGFSSDSNPTREEIEDYDKRFGENSDYYSLWNRGDKYFVDFYVDTLRRKGFDYLRNSFIAGSAFEIWYKLNHPKREK